MSFFLDLMSDLRVLSLSGRHDDDDDTDTDILIYRYSDLDLFGA